MEYLLQKLGIKEIVKLILYPVRRILTRLILLPPPPIKRKSSPSSSNIPIDLAANYTCAEVVEGDYLEFGCFRGSSFINAYNQITSAVEDWSSFDRAKAAFTDENRAKEAYNKVRKIKRRFFAFDSFDGLPEATGIDIGHPKFAKGRYDCSQIEFEKILKRAGVNMNLVHIVPGFYKESLNASTIESHQLKKAAIVMVDCDLYSSTQLVLDFITELLVEGSVIIFDDWFNYKANPLKGEQAACREWLRKNQQIKLVPWVRYSLTQMSFIVNINGNNSKR